jgi:hypothetical protein
MNEAFKSQQFKKGQSGNPKGRPPTGRQHFLACLDAELHKHGEIIVKNLIRDAKKRPIQFARDVLVPLIDKQMLVSAKDGDGKTAVWKFLVNVGVPEANADMAVKEAIDVESKEVPCGNPNNRLQKSPTWVGTDGYSDALMTLLDRQ